MEHLIDIFARDPNSLSDSDRDRIDALLDEHPEFRDYLDHLRDFYRSFRELSARDVPDHVRAFADSLVRLPRRLLLQPPAERKAARLHGPGYRFLRADAAANTATSRASGSGTLRTAGSLVSTEYGVLLRFIEDRDAGELRGYVLSPDQNDASTALVRFAALATPVPTDAAGVIRIPLDTGVSTDNLLSDDVELLLPVRSTRILPAELDGSEYATVLEHGAVVIEARSTASGVRLRMSGTTAEDFLLIEGPGERRLRQLVDGHLDLSIADPASGLSIHMYAE